MNLPTIFNIAIGLIFIYLVLSLFASQIQETIATLLEWRAKNLTSAIENLVSGEIDPDSQINNKTYALVDNIFKNPLIQNLNQTSKSWITKIRPQNKESNRNTINPTYMPAETFATSLLYELGIPRLGRLLTWFNAKKLIYNEIYKKIDDLIKNEQYQSYTNLKDNFQTILEDYKQERDGLSSTIIRLRNQVDNFKREIEAEIKKDPSCQSLINSINQIIELVFTPDKKDQDLVIRIRPSLTTLLDLLDKDSSTYKSFENEFNDENISHQYHGHGNTDLIHLYTSFNIVQKEFNEISVILPDSLRKSLYALALRSRIKALDIEQHLDQFKQEIETWFDRSMDRASGVYKRNARGFAFLIGFVLAVTLNADTFYIISRLAKDDALRNSIVNSSTKLFESEQSPTPSPSVNPLLTASPSPTPKSSPLGNPSPTPTPKSSLNAIERVERVKDRIDQSLSEITLPIGWNDNILEEQLQIPDPIKENETSEEKQNREKREKEKDRRKAKFFNHPIPPLLIMIMGWLITATAIMMGAPFWFDLLGLFVNVRNAGSKPASKASKK